MSRISDVPENTQNFIRDGNRYPDRIVRRAIETLRPEVNAAINGVWKVTVDGLEDASIVFQNGRFVFDKKGEPIQRGMYSISGKNISFTHRDNQSGSSLEKLNIHRRKNVVCYAWPRRSIDETKLLAIL